MKNNIESDKITYYTYYAAFFGMIVGSIFFLVITVATDVPVLENGLEDYKIASVLNLPIWNLSLYIIKRRLCQIVLFIILVILFSYPFVSLLYNMIFGIYFGMILSSLFMKFALKGVLYSIACFFPHYILYFFVIYIIGKWFFFEDRKKNIYYRNVNKLQYFIQISVIISAITFAVFWEIKFQKNFLNYFYQYLV